jgi:Fe2+ transport system protein FeoA
LTFDFIKAMSPFAHNAPFGTLAELQPGFQAAVLEVRGHDQPLCVRLQELGLVPGAAVEVISREGGLMVRIGEQRLALGEGLAQAVEVVPV